MKASNSSTERISLLQAKLADLGVYARNLCPDARVETDTISYDGEDGHVAIFPPPTLAEEEVDRVELALAARAGDIFEETGLFILCAAFEAD